MATVMASRILREAFGLVLENPLAYLRTVGVFVLAASAVSLGIDVLAPGLVPDPEALTAEQDPAAAAGIALRALGVSLAVSSVLAALTSLGWAVGVPTTRALTKGEQPPGLAEAWRAVVDRLPNYLASVAAAGLAIAAILLGGAILSFLIVPFVTALLLALWVGLRWCLIPPVSLLERHSFTENFDRSAELTQGHKVPIFLVYLLMAAVGVTALTVAALALSPAGRPGEWALAGIAALVQLVLVPVGVAATVRIYEEVSVVESPGDLSDDL